jgi:hypothetical protein
MLLTRKKNIKALRAPHTGRSGSLMIRRIKWADVVTSNTIRRINPTAPRSAQTFK